MIAAEGGADSLTTPELLDALHVRGLNLYNYIHVHPEMSSLRSVSKVQLLAPYSHPEQLNKPQLASLKQLLNDWVAFSTSIHTLTTPSQTTALAPAQQLSNTPSLSNANNFDDSRLDSLQLRPSSRPFDLILFSHVGALVSIALPPP